jgi:hypothetical protein
METPPQDIVLSLIPAARRHPAPTAQPSGPWRLPPPEPTGIGLRRLLGPDWTAVDALDSLLRRRLAKEE